MALDTNSVQLPLSMLVAFGAAKLLEELLERLGQPGIVGQILAGIVVGPHVLGWLAPNEFLTALAELGVMFLLFRVGLEVKSSELMRVGGTASFVAVLGVVVPFLLGAGLLLLWGHPRIEAAFTGAAMVATSVGITAQVLAAKGLLQHLASRIILGAAIIDDVLGLLILALVSSLAKERVNLLDLAMTGIFALAFTIIVAAWGTKAMRFVFPHLLRVFKGSEVQFTLAIVLLFALAAMSAYAGVAAIIGAFMAGMALAETVAHRVHSLTQGVTEFLVPFFLVGIGLNFDLDAFGSASTLWLGLAVLAAAIVSKFIGCAAGAFRLGWADARRVGVGMIPRGEVGMVVAQLGLSLGVIEQNIYAVVVFMSVATTLVAPPLLKLTFRGVRGSEEILES